MITGSGGDWRGAAHLTEKQILCVAADIYQEVLFTATFGAGMFTNDDGVLLNDCEDNIDPTA